MALNLVPLPIRDYAYTEAFGVKGAAELFLRAMIAAGTPELHVSYTPANSTALRNAAKRIRESDGLTFGFEKCGDTYREISYPVTRTLKDGVTKTTEITRSFLNVEAIRVTAVQAEADAAIAAEQDSTDTDS